MTALGTLMQQLAETSETEKAENRVRYHLRKKDMGLHRQRNGYFAIERDTLNCVAGPMSLAELEAWARLPR
ncbi:hypothetical protein [Shinella sp.]|uniref:hypothetical protein n=1 Tax=Shinella sp. TaxID=1870904 RepID=UPI00301BE231